MERKMSIKKRLLCAALLLGCGSIVFWGGCNSSNDTVSLEAYRKVVSERDELTEELETTQTERAALKKQNKEFEQKVETVNGSYETLKEEYENYKEEMQKLKEEYENYKGQMQKYEGLSEQEAEARKVEAARVLEEEKAKEEQKKKEEQEKKEKEEKLGYETGITYDQLARTPDDYEGKKVKFYGEVVQVMEGDEYVQIRFAVNSNYDKILFGEYSKSIVSKRVLEDDFITIYGKSGGLITYESTGGGQITIPSVEIDKIEMK